MIFDAKSASGFCPNRKCCELKVFKLRVVGRLGYHGKSFSRTDSYLSCLDVGLPVNVKLEKTLRDKDGDAVVANFPVIVPQSWT